MESLIRLTVREKAASVEVGLLTPQVLSHRSARRTARCRKRAHTAAYIALVLRAVRPPRVVATRKAASSSSSSIRRSLRSAPRSPVAVAPRSPGILLSIPLCSPYPCTLRRGVFSRGEIVSACQREDDRVHAAH